MKSLKIRSRSTVISTSRWTVYAAAGAATVFAGIHSAEAEIHYSGPVNANFNNDTILNFELGSDRVINFIHSIDYYSSKTKDGGNAFVSLGGSFAAVTSSCSYGVASAINLTRGDVISEQPFDPGKAVLATADRENCYGQARGQFLNAGMGFIGFKFNSGSGDQYGWARIEMRKYPKNNFTLIDYAYGDPGDSIKAGQRSGGHGLALESLGGLALGAAGLLAWRRGRRESR